MADYGFTSGENLHRIPHKVVKKGVRRLDAKCGGRQCTNKKQDLATQLKSPSGQELLEKFSFLQIYMCVRFMIKGTYHF
jgi:hypothetical protein